MISSFAPPALVLSLVLATGVPAQTPAPRPHDYLGTWNYDQPDRATMRNVAVIGATPPIHVPQIGDIVFTRTGDGVTGRTDQGCTWTFAVRPASLELDPPTQNCFNRVIGSAYTITRWSVTVSGDRERETIEAVSHQPTGDYSFRLDDGRRTRARAGAAARFTGAWRYDPADPATRVNIVTTRYTAPDRVVQAPRQGVVTFTRRRDVLTARTGDGCAWRLTARGNTAKLDPAGQTCGGTTLSFWTVASDGRRQASVQAGTGPDGGAFLLSVGALTRG
ncbi:hypothetical protein [Herbidospora sp. NBRC 101105]|uniref:hypothetical protein n=1 Tax=Herbidospora sp. NBRC 101105 TaxID=3032195 RepID=UPI0024A4947A|nr:hypothetical protein [Herbidospora sp. NBRC 101105]GLX97064.1 hypothetical protein Hesp01_50140 [Herbidospora sp. NBRC 101105]